MVIYFFSVVFGLSMGVYKNLHPYVALGHQKLQNEAYVSMTTLGYSLGGLFWGLLAYFICNFNENYNKFIYNSENAWNFDNTATQDIGNSFSHFAKLVTIIYIFFLLGCYIWLQNPPPIRNHFPEWFESKFFGSNQYRVGVNNLNAMDHIIKNYRDTYSYNSS